MFRFWRPSTKVRRTYLDYAAATPLHPEVRAAMEPFGETVFGNPSAIHTEGRAAKQALGEARHTVATLLGIRSEGVIFTAGGTESNVLAIAGYLQWLQQNGRSYADMEVITTPIEHPSVSETLAALTERGVVVREVAVDQGGKVVVSSLRELLSPRTVLCTMAYANSEIGTVQSVHTLARVLRAYGREQGGHSIALHIDAAQAPLWLPCDLPRLDADIVTIDAGKCGGPKGSGLVAMRKHIELSPVLYGGGQERGRRPGTENVAAAVGCAMALRLAQASWQKRAALVAKVRDEGIRILLGAIPGAVLNGLSGSDRLANNINISLLGFDTEYAVVVLDTAGIAASTKSACAGAGGGESHVVRAITADTARSRSTLRFSLGPETTVADLERAAAVLRKFTVQMGTLTQ
jgi:cysteine desulfurase